MSDPAFKTCVFLDLEGVVVTRGSIMAVGNTEGRYRPEGPGWKWFVDQTAINLIARLCFLAKASIIVTSTLRHDPAIINVTHALVYRHLELAWNRTKDSEFNFQISITERGRNRGEEIRQAIKDYGVEKYVAIDDYTVDIDNFVKVDSTFGFQFPQYVEAKQLLLPRDHPEFSEEIFLI